MVRKTLLALSVSVSTSLVTPTLIGPGGHCRVARAAEAYLAYI